MSTKISGNGIYSWWTQPLAVKRGSDTFFTAVTLEGYWRVFRNDSTDYVQLGTGNQDDHNVPCVVAEAGKDIIVFYTQHGVTSTVKYKKCSTWPTFGSEQTITFPYGTTYVNTITDPVNDTIYLFTRSSEQKWYVTKSTDWGDTWSTPILFFESSVTNARMYCLIQPSESESGAFHLAATGHPSDDWKTIRYGKIDIFNGEITSNEAYVANLDGTDLPLNEYSLEKAWEPSGTQRTRLLDIGDKDNKPYLLYARWDDSTTVPGYYNGVRNNSTNTWNQSYMMSSGGVFGPVEARKYVGGACIDRNGNNWIYLMRKLSSSYRIEKYTLDSSLQPDVGSTVVSESSNWVVRPVAVRGEDRVHWCKLINYNDFDDYQSHIYKD